MFVTESQVPSHRVVKWDGTTWSTVGNDYFPPSYGGVLALAVSGNDLYAGGYFSPALYGPDAANWFGGASYVAKWNGSAWSPLGSGVNRGVHSLAVSGNELYVGGEFTQAGGISANYIAKWNGSAWSALGTGMDGLVNSLAATTAADVYAAGYFSTAGGVTAYSVAKWNGSAWSSLGLGRSSAVSALAASGTDVYAGGTLSTITGYWGRSVAKWNGSVWSRLGSPMNDEIYALAVSGTDLYAGGQFTIAGGKPSAYAARAVLDLAEVAFTAASYAVNQGAGEVILTLERTGGSRPFNVTINTSDGTPSTVPPFAAAVAGADYTALSGSATTVVFAEGETSKEIVVPLIPQTATGTPNKKFTVFLSGPTVGAALGAISAASLCILANDAINPKLTLKTPIPARISATSPYLLTGTAGDAKGISRVEVVLNGGAPIVAALGAAITPTSVPFSVSISPVEGANTVAITAYDLRGNGTTVTRTFTFTRRYVLTAQHEVNAGGVTLAATPATAASAFIPAAAGSGHKTSDVLPGATVKLTATPKPGYVFSRWSGLPPGADALGNIATFTMPPENVESVVAGFVASPFVPLGGAGNNFLGPVNPIGGTAVSNATVGFLTGTLTASGGFTGRLLIDGLSQPIAASFYGDGSAVFRVGAKRQSYLNIGSRVLTLSFDNGAIIAVVTNGSSISEGTATRAIYSTDNKVPGALLNLTTKGFYTLRFRTRSAPASSYPQGHGFATISVSNTGGVAFAGTLADGTAVTASSALVGADNCPFFIPLITPGATAAVKGGSFSGVLAFDIIQDDSDVTGTDLLWLRSAAASAAIKLYHAGWPNGIHVDAIGAQYFAAGKVQDALALGNADSMNGNAELRFTGGKLSQDITRTNFNVVGNAVVKIPASDSTFTLRLTAATGAFSGTFTPQWPSPAATNPTFKGIFIQKGASKGGYGFFISNARSDSAPESGAVFLRRRE